MSAPSRASLVVLLVLVSGCSRLLDYPDVSAEDEPQACNDGVDNDLDGETDCADPDCVVLCPRSDVVARVSITPCFASSGFAFRQGLGLGEAEATCEPFAPNPPTCGPGTALLPIVGEDECILLGNDCPVGPTNAFPTFDGGPPGGTVFVRAGATGGTGTSSSPFGTIREALETSAPVIAIAGGTYVEDVLVERPVTIIGACVEHPRMGVSYGVRLVGGVFGDPVLQVASAGVTVRQLTIAPSGAAGVEVADLGELTLEDVEIVGATGVGVSVLAGASLSTERVGVRNVVGAGSAGVRVEAGGSASLLGSRFDGVMGVGIDSAGVLDAAAVIVARSGGGARITGGGTATFSGVALEPGAGTAMEVACADGPACVSLLDSVVRDMSSMGHGLDVRSGRIIVERTAFSSLLGWGIRVSGGAAELKHVIVRGTRPELGEGAGIRVDANGSLLGDHVRLRGNLFRGLNVVGGSAIVNDFELEGDQQTGTSGIGVHVSEGGSLIFMRFSIDSAGICGLELLGDDISFLGVEGVISDNARGACVDGDAVTTANLTNLITYLGNGRNIFVP